MLAKSVVAVAAFLAALAVLALQPQFIMPHRETNILVQNQLLPDVPHTTEGFTPIAQTPESAASLESSADDAGVRRTRLRITWGLIGQIWGWIVLATVAFGGLSPRLRDLSRQLAGGRLGTLSPYIVVLSVLSAISSAPISFYRDFVLEHEFGLSNQDFWAWLEDSAKGTGIALITGLIIFNVIYLLVRRAPRRWWLYSAVLVIVFSVVMSTLAPVLVTPLFNKFDPLQNETLKVRILELAGRGGVQVADVQQMDMSRQTRAANAYFIGIGPTKRIVLGDTLLEKFTEDEVLTVVAHEMGHQAHEDIWRLIGAGSILFLFAFHILYRSLGPLIQRSQHRLGFSRLDDPASLPLALLLVGLLFFLTQPAQNTFSRYVEHEADRYALELTHQNEVYAGALDKLGRVNISDPNPPGWMEFMFFTHPSLKNRIEFAETYLPWEE